MDAAKMSFFKKLVLSGGMGDKTPHGFLLDNFALGAQFLNR